MKRNLNSTCYNVKKAKCLNTNKNTFDTLRDCYIYIIPSRFGPGRLKIILNQVVNHGGQLFNIGDDPKLVTHVIAEETINAELLYKCCRVEEFSNALFLRCSWLVQSFKLRELKIPCENDSILTCPYVSNNIEEPLKQKINNTNDEIEKLLKCDNTGSKPIYKDLGSELSNLSDKSHGCSESHANKLPEAQGFEKDFLTNSSNYDFTEKFVCAHSSSNPLTHPNKYITDELEKLASAYENKKDTWRAVGYQKAISAIKNYSKEILTWEEARKIRGIGDRLADKIKEILERGELRKVKEVCENEETKVLQLFMGVWGAGATTANNWYLQGFRTLDDLKLKASLTKHQEIGVKYYEELNERMLRTEVIKIEEQVRAAADKIRRGLEVIVCGSYRRGKDTCGDVDILITHPDGISHINVFKDLLENLWQCGFLTDDLVIQEHNGNQQKYLGVCKLPGEFSKHRRLDVIVVPYKEYAPALMYFTGSAHFNRSMRLLATKLGMSLSEHGLRKGIVRDNKGFPSGGTLLDTETEESIFAHLGLKYRPPSERNH